MSPRRFLLPLFACVVLLVTSCATSQPVRNLASDASLIKPGQTSSQEVIHLIGEPDQRQAGGNGQETWIYHEKETSWVKKAPLVGRLFNPHKEESLTLVIRDNVVASSRYGSLAYNKPGWDKDFDWQGDKK
ncbi:MAG: hypothetical protein LBH14_01090 [Desulfobulbaceae bacterium]|jgi:hypothetical protein|nr:hypothetical protein [Desulfobulbaceae bacterium]